MAAANYSGSCGLTLSPRGSDEKDTESACVSHFREELDELLFFGEAQSSCALSEGGEDDSYGGNRAARQSPLLSLASSHHGFAAREHATEFSLDGKDLEAGVCISSATTGGNEHSAPHDFVAKPVQRVAYDMALHLSQVHDLALQVIRTPPSQADSRPSSLNDRQHDKFPRHDSVIGKLCQLCLQHMCHRIRAISSPSQPKPHEQDAKALNEDDGSFLLHVLMIHVEAPVDIKKSSDSSYSFKTSTADPQCLQTPDGRVVLFAKTVRPRTTAIYGTSHPGENPAAFRTRWNPTNGMPVPQNEPNWSHGESQSIHIGIGIAKSTNLSPSNAQCLDDADVAAVVLSAMSEKSQSSIGDLDQCLAWLHCQQCECVQQYTMDPAEFVAPFNCPVFIRLRIFGWLMGFWSFTDNTQATLTRIARTHVDLRFFHLTKTIWQTGTPTLNQQYERASNAMGCTLLPVHRIPLKAALKDAQVDESKRFHRSGPRKIKSVSLQEIFDAKRPIAILDALLQFTQGQATGPRCCNISNATLANQWRPEAVQVKATKQAKQRSAPTGKVTKAKKQKCK